jgi:putative ABC transport system permease protein
MMEHHQLKITLRRLYRNRTFSLLNIAGLSVGIAISVLIFLIITSELSIDRFSIF